MHHLTGFEGQGFPERALNESSHQLALNDTASIGHIQRWDGDADGVGRNVLHLARNPPRALVGRIEGDNGGIGLLVIEMEDKIERLLRRDFKLALPTAGYLTKGRNGQEEQQGAADNGFHIHLEIFVYGFSHKYSIFFAQATWQGPYIS